jgi:hypothetical protein
MPDKFLIHLPDGSEYGPVDRATLRAWSDEGRLPPSTLVWPEGTPAWLGVEEALALGAEPAPAAPAVEPEAAAPPVSAGPGSEVAPSPAPVPDAAAPRAVSSTDHSLGPGSRGPRPVISRPTARPEASGPRVSRTLLAATVGLLALLGALAALWMLLGPWLAKRREVAAVQAYATSERRVEDAQAGLVADLPPGWIALRPDNPYVPATSGRLRLAQPAVPVFAGVAVAASPRHMDDLDAHLDDLLRERLPRRPSMKAGARADVTLGRGQGRLVRTTWDDDLAPMQGETVAWADGYQVFTLEAWAPAAAGARLSSEVAALCRGLAATGLAEARLAEAVDRLSLEVPELSKDALRLLVAERMSQGRGMEDVPESALRLVSRGLDALAPGEAAEMRAIYQQVWAPVQEARREHLAALYGAVRAGRVVPSAELAALRDAVKAGVLALPPEQRSRLQELSDRAVRESLQKP